MRFLVATDGSDAADRAVEFAARLTKKLKGDLKIVHVVAVRDVPLIQLDAYVRSNHVRAPEAMTTFSKEKLAIARQRAEALEAFDVDLESQLELQEGDVGGAIIDAARRNEIDVIVLGKRGLGRTSGLLLGSVSQRVVSVAPCAVIVVP
jgi:nucleotide-binding universal stress UspA family protein